MKHLHSKTQTNTNTIVYNNLNNKHTNNYPYNISTPNLCHAIPTICPISHNKFNKTCTKFVLSKSNWTPSLITFDIKNKIR